MHVPWNELGSVRTLSALIETAAGFVLAGYCTVAFCSVVKRRTTEKARGLVADGALTALSFILCATLLKTLALTSWKQIGLFACVLSLRTVMKKVFAAEARRSMIGVDSRAPHSRGC